MLKITGDPRQGMSVDISNFSLKIDDITPHVISFRQLLTYESYKTKANLGEKLPIGLNDS